MLGSCHLDLRGNSCLSSHFKPSFQRSDISLTDISDMVRLKVQFVLANLEGSGMSLSWLMFFGYGFCRALPSCSAEVCLVSTALLHMQTL